MKKIISMVLCVMMLASVLMFDTSAKTADEHEQYTMMANNILMAQLYEKQTPTTRLKQLLDAYEYYSPDIVALQECDVGWHEALDGDKGLVTLGYASVFEENSDIELSAVYNPIYYKKDKFEVIDSGLTRYVADSIYTFTWAVLESKKSGDRFAVVDTHFIWGSLEHWPVRQSMAKELEAGVRAIEEKYGVPFIAMGDYNSHLNEAAYKYLSNTFKSARQNAKVALNMQYKTSTHFGKAPEVSLDGLSQIDHCFYSNNGIVGEKYEVLTDPLAYAYADHVPHMFTFWVTGLDHKHEISDTWESYSADEHRSPCYCGEYTYESHDMAEGFLTSEDKKSHGRGCGKCDYFESLPHEVRDGEYIDADTHRGICAYCGEECVSAHYYTWESNGNECVGKCSCGADTTREHEYDCLPSDDENYHIATCECGRSDLKSHTWGEGETVVKTTYSTDGVTKYACIDCGKEREENIPAYKIPDSPYELYEGGQRSMVIEGETKKAPSVDGRIKSGEYTFMLDNISHDTDVENDLFYFLLPGIETDVSGARVGIAYDSNCIYLAAEVKDNLYNSYGDYVSFFIGTSDKIEELCMVYIPRYKNGVPEIYPYGHKFDEASRIPPQAEALCAEYVAKYKTSDNGGTVTYEIALRRDKLPNPEATELFFLCGISSEGNSIVQVGFDTKGIEEVYPKMNGGYAKATAYPHILVLGSMPETQSPETNEPETNEPETSVPETSVPDREGGCKATFSTAAIVVALCACFAALLKKEKE